MFKRLFKNNSAGKEDTLKKRYFYKLSTNLVGLGVGAIVQAIIPRGLGPRAYGDYNFLVNFFTQVVNFFDMGTSLGFYTKLSQRPKERNLISFYLYFIAIVTILIIAIVALARVTDLYKFLWPGQLLRYVYLSLFLCVLIWLSNVLTRIADAFGLTVSTEKAKVFQKLLGLVFIIFIFYWHKLSLGAFFFYNYCILIILLGVFYYILGKNGHNLASNLKIASSDFKKYAKEFYQYSHPFFLYSLVGMITAIVDRWFLQVFSGSLEQGFFGLSYQIGAICFMFTSAMTPLIIREFSVAYNNNNIASMTKIFRKHIPLLYAITALLACFVAVNSDKVTVMIGGGKFYGATIAVAIMAFFPIHQTYGQLSGSVFYASNRTKLYCSIGIIFMVLGLPLTYFFVAPKELFGLNSGASGLAYKMVLLQFLAVNVQLYFNSKLMKFSFWKYLIHQLACILVFVILAMISKLIIDYTMIIRFGMIANFLCNLILYLIAAAFFIYFLPITIGSDRKGLNAMLRLR